MELSDLHVPGCPTSPAPAPADFRPMRSRGRETSNALVEVRTVLSRAETALDTIRRTHESWRDPEALPYHKVADEDWSDFLDRAYIDYEDEDKGEMIAALEHVVESLEWWRRTGRPKKGAA